MTWYALAKHVLIGPVLRVWSRPTIVGRCHIPSRGPVIVAANHMSFIDSLLICLAVGRPVVFVAKSEYFDRPGWRGRVQRWFFGATGQLRIDRSGGERSADALSAATELLLRGDVWGIHPEGTRCVDGMVHRGRTGVMRVARETGAVVVPVGIRGTGRTREAVEVVIGRPIESEVVAGDPRAATDHLMAEIAVLAGRPYVDEYARPQ